MTLTLKHDSLNLHLIRQGTLHLKASPVPAGEEEAETFALLLRHNGLIPDAALLRRITEASSDDLREAALAVRAACDDHAELPRVRDWHQRDTRTPLLERLIRLTDIALSSGLEGCALLQETGTPARPCLEAMDGLVSTGACAICHRRTGDPQMLLSEAELNRLRGRDSQEPRRTLRLNTEPADWVGQHLTRLATADRILNEEEKSSLAVLCSELNSDQIGVIATEIGKMTLKTRETPSLIAGHLLRVTGNPAELCLLIWPGGQHSVVDITRALDVMGGGNGTLERMNVPRMPRSLRRAVIAAMNRSLEHAPERRLTLNWELAQKHAPQIKRLMARLHPHEQPSSPTAKFAALISTDGLPQGRKDPHVRRGLEEMITQAGQTGQMKSLMASVEARLNCQDVLGAARELSARPGVLARTLVRLIRAAKATEARKLLELIQPALAQLSATQLLTLRGALIQAGTDTGRMATAQSSGVSVILAARTALEPSVTEPYLNAIGHVLLTRAACLPALTELHVDPALLGVRLSASARHEQSGLASGSVIPLAAPDLKHLTLFTHWVEEKERIDLDLSVILMRGNEYAGTTNFSRHFKGAFHSGDLTSAPAPAGATEFITLDLEQLRSAGVTSALMVVNSFTGDAFNQCTNRSGIMTRSVLNTDYRDLEPSAIVVRAEARGSGTSLIVAELNIEEGAERLTWLNIVSEVHGVHDAHRAGGLLEAALGTIGGQGINLMELAATHAARTTTVQCGEERLQRGEEGNEEWTNRVERWLKLQATGEGATQAPAGGMSLLRHAPPNGGGEHLILEADTEHARLTTLIQQLDLR